MATNFTSKQNRTFGYRGKVQDESGKTVIKQLSIGPFEVLLPSLDEIRAMPDHMFARNGSGEYLNAALATAENAMQQPLIGVIRNRNQDAIQSQDSSAFSLSGIAQTWEEWEAYVNSTGGTGIAEARRTFFEGLSEFCDTLAEQRGIPRAVLKQIENACKSRDGLSFMEEGQKEKVRKLINGFMDKLREAAPDAASAAQPAHDELTAALVREASISDIDLGF